MATAALPPAATIRVDGFERGMITAAVMLATIVQILDTTIANVALPHMQTSLGATPETVTWVLTSYIVASAIAIPITGWLSDRIGRKPLFVWATIAFTAASALCAIAQNLPEMVLFRVLQGIAGAFIVPLAQAVLFDINPPQNHGRAMALFGGGVMVGPILGPILGGWLTDSFNWRWVFLINLPIGAIAVAMLVRFLPSSDTTRRRFDLFGFVLLALALGGLQMMLDRGEQIDWFQSWETWIEAGLFVGAAWMFAVHMATGKAPIFEPEMFTNRNLVTGLLVMLVMGLLMFGGLALLPPLLQRLFGYSVLQSGILTAPRGVGTLVSMIVAGRLVGKVDARVLIAFGLSMIALSLWQMSSFTLVMSREPIIVSGLIQGFGLGFIFVPLNTLAFGTLEARYRTTAASLLNLSRSMGGSIGISLVSVLLARNLQQSHSDLAQHVTETQMPMIEPALSSMLGATGNAALAVVDAEINRQALMIAYVDDFYLMMWITIAALPLVLLLRKVKSSGAPAMIAD